MSKEQELEQHVRDILLKNYQISTERFVLLVHDTPYYIKMCGK